MFKVFDTVGRGANPDRWSEAVCVSSHPARHRILTMQQGVAAKYKARPKGGLRAKTKSFAKALCGVSTLLPPTCVASGLASFSTDRVSVDSSGYFPFES